MTSPGRVVACRSPQRRSSMGPRRRFSTELAVKTRNNSSLSSDPRNETDVNTTPTTSLSNHSLNLLKNRASISATKERDSDSGSTGLQMSQSFRSLAGKGSIKGITPDMAADFLQSISPSRKNSSIQKADSFWFHPKLKDPSSAQVKKRTYDFPVFPDVPIKEILPFIKQYGGDFRNSLEKLLKDLSALGGKLMHRCRAVSEATPSTDEHLKNAIEYVLRCGQLWYDTQVEELQRLLAVVPSFENLKSLVEGLETHLTGVDNVELLSVQVLYIKQLLLETHQQSQNQEIVVNMLRGEVRRKDAALEHIRKTLWNDLCDLKVAFGKYMIEVPRPEDHNRVKRLSHKEQLERLKRDEQLLDHERKVAEFSTFQWDRLASIALDNDAAISIATLKRVFIREKARMESRHQAEILLKQYQLRAQEEVIENLQKKVAAAKDTRRSYHEKYDQDVAEMHDQIEELKMQLYAREKAMEYQNQYNVQQIQEACQRSEELEEAFVELKQSLEQQEGELTKLYNKRAIPSQDFQKRTSTLWGSIAKKQTMMAKFKLAVDNLKSKNLDLAERTKDAVRGLERNMSIVSELEEPTSLNSSMRDSDLADATPLGDLRVDIPSSNGASLVELPPALMSSRNYIRMQMRLNQAEARVQNLLTEATSRHLAFESHRQACPVGFYPEIPQMAFDPSTATNFSMMLEGPTHHSPRSNDMSTQTADAPGMKSIPGHRDRERLNTADNAGKRRSADTSSNDDPHTPTSARSPMVPQEFNYSSIAKRGVNKVMTVSRLTGGARLSRKRDDTSEDTDIPSPMSTPTAKAARPKPSDFVALTPTALAPKMPPSKHKFLDVVEQAQQMRELEVTANSGPEATNELLEIANELKATTDPKADVYRDVAIRRLESLCQRLIRLLMQSQRDVSARNSQIQEIRDKYMELMHFQTMELNSAISRKMEMLRRMQSDDPMEIISTKDCYAMWCESQQEIKILRQACVTLYNRLQMSESSVKAVANVPTTFENFQELTMPEVLDYYRSIIEDTYEMMRVLIKTLRERGKEASTLQKPVERYLEHCRWRRSQTKTLLEKMNLEDACLGIILPHEMKTFDAEESYIRKQLVELQDGLHNGFQEKQNTKCLMDVLTREVRHGLLESGPQDSPETLVANYFQICANDFKNLSGIDALEVKAYMILDVVSMISNIQKGKPSSEQRPLVPDFVSLIKTSVQNEYLKTKIGHRLKDIQDAKYSKNVVHVGIQAHTESSPSKVEESASRGSTSGSISGRSGLHPPSIHFNQGGGSSMMGMSMRSNTTFGVKMVAMNTMRINKMAQKRKPKEKKDKAADTKDLCDDGDPWPLEAIQAINKLEAEVFKLKQAQTLAPQALTTPSDTVGPTRGDSVGAAIRENSSYLSASNAISPITPESTSITIPKLVLKVTHDENRGLGNLLSQQSPPSPHGDPVMMWAGSVEPPTPTDRCSSRGGSNTKPEGSTGVPVPHIADAWDPSNEFFVKEKQKEDNNVEPADALQELDSYLGARTAILTSMKHVKILERCLTTMDSTCVCGLAKVVRLQAEQKNELEGARLASKGLKRFKYIGEIFNIEDKTNQVLESMKDLKVMGPAITAAYAQGSQGQPQGHDTVKAPLSRNVCNISKLSMTSTAIVATAAKKLDRSPRHDSPKQGRSPRYGSRQGSRLSPTRRQSPRRQSRRPNVTPLDSALLEEGNSRMSQMLNRPLVPGGMRPLGINPSNIEESFQKRLMEFQELSIKKEKIEETMDVLRKQRKELLVEVQSSLNQVTTFNISVRKMELQQQTLAADISELQQSKQMLVKEISKLPRIYVPPKEEHDIDDMEEFYQKQLKAMRQRLWTVRRAALGVRAQVLKMNGLCACDAVKSLDGIGSFWEAFDVGSVQIHKWDRVTKKEADSYSEEETVDDSQLSEDDEDHSSPTSPRSPKIDPRLASFKLGGPSSRHASMGVPLSRHASVEGTVTPTTGGMVEPYSFMQELLQSGWRPPDNAGSAAGSFPAAGSRSESFMIPRFKSLASPFGSPYGSPRHSMSFERASLPEMVAKMLENSNSQKSSRLMDPTPAPSYATTFDPGVAGSMDLNPHPTRVATSHHGYYVVNVPEEGTEPPQIHGAFVPKLLSKDSPPHLSNHARLQMIQQAENAIQGKSLSERAGKGDDTSSIQTSSTPRYTPGPGATPEETSVSGSDDLHDVTLDEMILVEAIKPHFRPTLRPKSAPTRNSSNRKRTPTPKVSKPKWQQESKAIAAAAANVTNLSILKRAKYVKPTIATRASASKTRFARPSKRPDSDLECKGLNRTDAMVNELLSFGEDWQNG